MRLCLPNFLSVLGQYFGLGKCHSTDFDAHITHISMTCILFMALALKKRFDCHETIGQLFSSSKTRNDQKTLTTKMWLLFRKIIQSLTAFFDFEPKMLIKKVFDDSLGKHFIKLFDNTPLLE